MTTKNYLLSPKKRGSLSILKELTELNGASAIDLPYAVMQIDD